MSPFRTCGPPGFVHEANQVGSRKEAFAGGSRLPGHPTIAENTPLCIGPFRRTTQFMIHDPYKDREP